MVRTGMSAIPVIDVTELLSPGKDALETIKSIGRACRDHGFFYISNHGIDEHTCKQAFKMMKGFFDLPIENKNEIHVKQSHSYQGYFNTGEEETLQRIDWKEGIYFFPDYAPDRPEVLAKKPLYSTRQWPREELVPGFKEFLTYWDGAMTSLGYVLMSALAQSLGLDKNYFKDRFTSEPFTQILTVHYPPHPELPEGSEDIMWGCGQHTDYGVLTILLQDDVGGLQVLSKQDQWIEAPPIPGTFLINLGDMLEIWTGGAYTARPHRVKVSRSRSRYSLPYFFDPGPECVVEPISLENAMIPVQAIESKLNVKLPVRYGDYATRKYNYNLCQGEAKQV